MILFILLLLSCSTSAELNVNILKDYLQWQKLRTVIVFHCLDQYDDVVHLSSSLSRWYNGNIHYEDISSFSPAKWNYHHVMRFDHQKLGVTLDMACPQTAELFGIMSATESFNASYHWLLLGNDSLDSVSCQLRAQNLNIDAKVTLVVKETAEEPGNSRYTVYDIYSVLRERGSALNATLMGSWSGQDGFNIVVSESEYQRRYDFGGIYLTGGVALLDQLHHKTLLEELTNQDPGIGFSLHKSGYQLWSIVMEKHNFSIRLLRSTAWWVSTKNGSKSNTLLGQLASREIDLAINGLTYIQYRIAILDYTVTVELDRSLIIFRHPRTVSSRNTFLKPFCPSLWIAILTTCVLATIILLTTFAAENATYTYEKGIQDNRSLVAVVIIGILSLQGFTCRTNFFSSRIVLLSMLFFSILLYQFYSIFFVGYLLILPPKTMKTLKHILDSDLKVAVEDLGYHLDYYNRTTDPVAIELYHRKILNGERNVVPITEGIALVKRGGYALQCDTAYAYPRIRQSFTDQEICDLQEVYSNPMRPLHLPLRKGSPFREMFRITLRKLVETGVTRHFQAIFFSDKPKCTVKQLDTVAVNFEQVSTAFYWMGYFLLGSLGLLVFELVYFNAKNRIRKVKFQW